MKIDKRTIRKRSIKGMHNILPLLMLKKTAYDAWNKVEIDDFDKYILKSGLVGPPGAHSRENIIEKTNIFIGQQQNGEDGDYSLGLPILGYDDIINMVVSICDNVQGIEGTKGEDWVSLWAFKKGIMHAAKKALEVAKKSGTILMASGHSESLAPAYTYIGKCLVEKGAKLYNPSVYPILSGGKQWLGSISNVTMLFRDAKVSHTHDDCGIDKIWEKEGIRPDLVIGDHGFAGAAIRAGIPTVAIVDTNDIELLVAICIYPDRIFPIPIHDNAGIHASMAMAYYFEDIIKNF